MSGYTILWWCSLFGWVTRQIFVGVDVVESGPHGDPVQGSGHLVTIEWAAFPDDESVEVIGAAGLVSVEEFDELWVQWDVAVVVEFADRHA